jgi:hypothetical protein
LEKRLLFEFFKGAITRVTPDPFFFFGTPGTNGWSTDPWVPGSDPWIPFGSLPPPKLIKRPAHSGRDGHGPFREKLFFIFPYPCGRHGTSCPGHGPVLYNPIPQWRRQKARDGEHLPKKCRICLNVGPLRGAPALPLPTPQLPHLKIAMGWIWKKFLWHFTYLSLHLHSYLYNHVH